MENFEPFPHFATQAIHHGQDAEQWAGNPVVPPISLATTFKQEEPGKHAGFEYSRSGNPTRNVTETCIAKLENGTECMLFSSGLGATTTICHSLKSGDHVVSMDDVYGGTNRYFRRVAVNLGIQTSFVDMTDLSQLKQAIRPETKMLWLESPTNPLMKIVDIAAAAEIAHQHAGIIVVVDNTFMTPYFQRPLDLGADVVIHSLTKYMNGHSDVVMGAVIAKNPEIIARLRFLQNACGAIPSPFDCYLVNRGLKTLHLRMREHMRNGLEVAHYLEKHPLVERVIHPGLKSHPQHELAKRQMRGYSGMITFYIKGGETEARKFLSTLKLFTLAESLGGYEGLAEHPGIMTHASIAKEEREKLGITDGLIRLSVGIENIEDIIADLDNAFKAVAALHA